MPLLMFVFFVYHLREGKKKMKFVRIFAVVLAMILLVGNAMAVPPGRTVEFEGGKAGKVVFDGKVHAEKGLKCGDCHTSPKLFAKKKGADTITMADINAGKFCGACHDGKTAFKSSDAANCGKCHQK